MCVCVGGGQVNEFVVVGVVISRPRSCASALVAA